VQDHRSEFAFKSVLELGSGVGMSGILMSHYCGSPCVLTDGVDEILDLLRQNVALNGLTDKGKYLTKYFAFSHLLTLE